MRIRGKLLAWLISISALLCCPILVAAQGETGHRISITIKGLENQPVSLGYYFGAKQYSKDSLVLDSSGTTVFEGEKAFPGGVYLIVFPNKMWIEFIAGSDQHFELVTDARNPLGMMQIKGSEENQIFYNYQKAMGQLQNVKRQTTKQLQKAPHDVQLTEQLEKVNTEIKNVQSQIIQARPDYLLSKIINMMMDIDIPDPPRKADGSLRDSMWAFYYERNHYFDNVDWTDQRIVRTPVFHRRFERYFDRYVPQHQDSIVVHCDRVLKLAEADAELHKYVLMTLFSKYKDSKILGMERVPFHLYREYYAAGKAEWASDEFREDWDKRTGYMENTLHGDTLMNFEFQDPDGNMVELHKLESPLLLLFFWDPECSHCKKYLPGVLEVYNKYRNSDIKFVGINVERDYDKWVAAIRDNNLTWLNVYDGMQTMNIFETYHINGTPMMYMLDKNKVVMWKRIPPQNLLELVELELGRLKK